MQLDSQGLMVQQAAETARWEAGKLGMKVLQQQMQVCCVDGGGNVLTPTQHYSAPNSKLLATH